LEILGGKKMSKKGSHQIHHVRHSKKGKIYGAGKGTKAGECKHNFIKVSEIPRGGFLKGISTILTGSISDWEDYTAEMGTKEILLICSKCGAEKKIKIGVQKKERY
jgi:hypothetical protein